MTFLELIGNEFKFTGVDKNEYKLVPLSLTEWGKFVVWVQWKPYRDALAAELPEHICEEIKQKCSTGKVVEETEEGLKEFPINLSSTCVRDAMATYDGLGKLIKLSLEISHGPITGPLSSIVDLEKFNEIQSEVLRQNGLAGDTDSEEPEKN